MGDGRRIGESEQPRMMQVAHPVTGEMVNPDVLAYELLRLAAALESEAAELQTATLTLGRIKARWEDACDEGAAESHARSGPERERDGRRYARTIIVDGVYDDETGEPMNLDAYKTQLEHAVRAKRDSQHTLRAIVSSWQTAARTIGVVVNL